MIGGIIMRRRKNMEKKFNSYEEAKKNCKILCIVCNEKVCPLVSRDLIHESVDSNNQ